MTQRVQNMLVVAVVLGSVAISSFLPPVWRSGEPLVLIAVAVWLTNHQRARRPWTGRALPAAGPSADGALWSGTASGQRRLWFWLPFVGLVFVGRFLGGGNLTTTILIFAYVPVVVVVVIGSYVRVTVGPAAVVSAFGPFGWPSVSIPLTQILHAGGTTVTELGRRRYADATTIGVRRGPALQVDRVDGRSFVVSVDDPETAAAVINRRVTPAPAA